MVAQNAQPLLTNVTIRYSREVDQEAAFGGSEVDGQPAPGGQTVHGIHLFPARRTGDRLEGDSQYRHQG